MDKKDILICVGTFILAILISFGMYMLDYYMKFRLLTQVFNGGM